MAYTKEQRREYDREYRKNNREKLRAYGASYRAANREKINAKQQAYRRTLEYAYKDQRQAARQRGIAWEFTYETWLAVWVMSGQLDQRGRDGYQMCRFSDTGPYSPSNVYIAHHTDNKRDAYESGSSWLAKQHAACMVDKS